MRRYDGPLHRARKDAAMERAKAYAFDYLGGKTLHEIGQANGGVTREYIRQCITKHFGSLASLGGQSVSARANEKARQEAKDAASLEKWGCPYNEYLKLRKMHRPTRAYGQQRKNADIRGIEWKFNLWTWWTFWQESGHWNERGRCGEAYVMGRFGDAGPYSPDNCYIAKVGDNIRHYHERRHGNLTEFSTARAA